MDKSYWSILEKLVGFDTTSRNSNLALVDFIVSYLKGLGVEVTLVPNKGGDKASIYAVIGPKHVSGIGLSAHTDVVPVDGQHWSTDPFQLVEQDGKYFGRGACDMKGFLACVLASVPEMVKGDLEIPIHLLFSYDEEIGCIGVRPMISELGRSLVKPRMVIVGEPSEMQVVEAHKGIRAFVTEVTGKEAHSSVVDLGVNAIFYASRFISELDCIGKDLREIRDERFTPPFSSLHVGTIEGGTALNIVPKKCRFKWEIRSIPGFDFETVMNDITTVQQELSSEMRDVCEDVGIETVEVNQVPTFQTAKSGEGEALISLALRCAEQNELGAVSYGTEAGLFELGDCPTVICGPGNIEQAHKPDEFVEIEQLDKCMIFLDNIIKSARIG